MHYDICNFLGFFLEFLALAKLRGDVKIPTYKPHTNHKKPSVSSHTLAPTTICDLSHSVCRSPLTDLGHISLVTYVCHPFWFVSGHRKGILTSPLNCNRALVWSGSPAVALFMAPSTQRQAARSDTARKHCMS